jgi:hypothetical protein
MPSGKVGFALANDPVTGVAHKPETNAIALVSLSFTGDGESVMQILNPPSVAGPVAVAVLVNILM